MSIKMIWRDNTIIWHPNFIFGFLLFPNQKGKKDKKGETCEADIRSPRFVFVAHGKGFLLMINYLLLGMTTFKVSTLILSDLPLVTTTTLCCWYSCGFWQRQRQLLELVRSTASFWDLEKGLFDFKPMQAFLFKRPSESQDLLLRPLKTAQLEVPCDMWF